MKVYCYPVSRDSAYVPLLFTGLEDRYQPVYREEGPLRRAIDEIKGGRPVIVHIHWEEFVFRACTSDAQADAAAADFLGELSEIKALNGPIAWTIHNELPHVLGFHRQFLAVRRRLAGLADVILVHNAASIDALAAQVDLDRGKVQRLAHPSYLGRHENEATLQRGLAAPHAPVIQGFGWIRLQKGFGAMIDMLPPAFLAPRGLGIRISGRGEEAAAVKAQHATRTDVDWDIRHVPDAEAPGLLRSAACVVLPYERVLTSGVALLAMSVGAMLVAVDIPQLRELVPDVNHRFLYPRADTAAFQAVIDTVLSLSRRDRRDAVSSNISVARDICPLKVARKLACTYDLLRSENRGRPAERPA